jgi:hypothetical protein
MLLSCPTPLNVRFVVSWAMAKRTLQLGRPSPIPASPAKAVLDRVANPHPDTDYVARLPRLNSPRFARSPVNRISRIL